MDEQRNDIPTRSWFLSAEELAATRAKLTTILIRAERKGFSGSMSLDAVPATRIDRVPGGLPVTVHGFDVTLTGTPPHYAGWRFVAAVDALPDGGTIIRHPPGQDAGVRNNDIKAGLCDHCQTKRDRRSTVLVANDKTGQLLQVGRSCLKDFLGHALHPVFLTEDEIREQLGASLAKPASAWDIESVVAYAWAAVEGLGWSPSTASDFGRVPTRDVVQRILTHHRDAEKLLPVVAPYLEDGQRRAPEIIRELLTGLTEPTGYQANLTNVLRAGVVTPRHLGLAVSAIPAHQRLHEQREHEAARQQAASVAEYVGKVGEKVTLSGTVRTAMRVDGYTHRSPNQVLLVIDCGTAVAKMTTAAAWAYGVRTGDSLTVTGTVKAHSEWRDTKQTVLSRPKKHDPRPPDLPDAAQTASTTWEQVQCPSPDGANAARRNVAPPTSRQLSLPL